MQGLDQESRNIQQYSLAVITTGTITIKTIHGGGLPQKRQHRRVARRIVGLLPAKAEASPGKDRSAGRYHSSDRR